jgi:hypothetical protein
MRVRLVIGGVVVGTTAGIAVSRIGRWRRTWGIDASEAVRALPGDAVVPRPVAIETRGITIDAPPDRVWPWLVQMGFGKAGWYSYDRLDMRGGSADRIVDAWQTLKVGDIVPTHPGGGFEVVEIVPGQSLVLRSDTALMTAQAEAWAKRTAAATDGDDPIESVPAGLAASGALLGATPQQFAASWAFTIEPIAAGRSRLIERFRVWFGESGMASTVVMPVVGFGVFVMLQRQMVGIKTRAERLAREWSAATVPAASVVTAPPVALIEVDESTSPAKSERDLAEEPELAAAAVD